MKIGNLRDLITAIFYVVVILYLTTMSPQLPQVIRDLFKNSIFRIIILFMILVLLQISEGMALLVSIAFVVTMNNLEQKGETLKMKDSDLDPEEKEDKDTGCFEDRTIDISKVLPTLENENTTYGLTSY